MLVSAFPLQRLRQNMDKEGEVSSALFMDILGMLNPIQAVRWRAQIVV